MKRFICILMCLCFVLTGCGSNNKENALRFDIEKFPGVLDPQMASEKEAVLILTNTMSGLMKVTSEGKTVPDLADSCKVSNDLKTYTFTLKDGLKWQDERPLTADDFVFALRRIVSPETNSPYFYRYTNILNAKEIRAGEKEISSLGAFAKDDKTLVIELCEPDFSFPSLMAQTSSYPCNKEFFDSCKGKYGISPKNMLSCGSFYISSLDEGLMLLKRNSSALNPAKTEKLYFCVGRGNSTDAFLEGRSEICIVPFNEYEKIKTYPMTRIFDRTFSLIVNPQSEIGQNEVYRKVLMTAASEGKKALENTEILIKAQGIIPPATLLEDINYRNEAGEIKFKENIDFPLMKEEIHREINENGGGKFPKSEIITDEGDFNFTAASTIQNIYADKLSIYVNISSLGNSQLLGKVKAHNYDLALTEIRTPQDKPYMYLIPFGDITFEWEGEEISIRDILEKAENSNDRNEQIRLYKRAEEALINAHYVMPLYHAPTYIVLSKGVGGVEYVPSKHTLFFGNAVLKEK